MWECLANLLDESWVGEIWELFGSSSISSDDRCFFGVNGNPATGSWSTVTDTDCCIKHKLVNKMDAKFAVG